MACTLESLADSRARLALRACAIVCGWFLLVIPVALERFSLSDGDPCDTVWFEYVEEREGAISSRRADILRQHTVGEEGLTKNTIGAASGRVAKG